MAARIANQLEIARSLKEEQRKRYHQGILEPPEKGKLLESFRGYLGTSSREQKFMDALDLVVQGPKKVAAKAAVAGGLGMAMRKLAQRISAKDIFKAFKGGIKPADDIIYSTGDTLSGGYQRMLRDNPHMEKDMKRTIRFFNEAYLNAPSDKGLPLKGFKIKGTGDALGSYTPDTQKIRVNYLPQHMSPDPTAHGYMPGSAGHELEHWWSDFIKDQTVRLSRNDQVMFTPRQFEKTRDTFRDLIYDSLRDPDVALGAKSELLRTFNNVGVNVQPLGRDALGNLLSDDKMLARAATWYKSWGYPTEHASVGFQKIFNPKFGKFGENMIGDDAYTASKAFSRASFRFKAMSFDETVKKRIIENSVSKAMGTANPKTLEKFESMNNIFKRYRGAEKLEVQKRFQKALQEARGKKK